MRKGHWAVTHQGIAFDTNGNLIDGQHRLEAIRISGVSVKIMVTTGVPEVASSNGLSVFSMDAVDRGKLRSVGDQLVLRHGCTNGNVTAGVCQQIALICNSGNYVKLSVPSAVSILDIYKNENVYSNWWGEDQTLLENRMVRINGVFEVPLIEIKAELNKREHVKRKNESKTL